MNSRQNIFIFSLIIILLTPGWSVFASEKSPGNLYALSAVLMDGDSGEFSIRNQVIRLVRTRALPK